MDNKRVEQPLSPDEVKELKKLITEKTAQIVNGNRRRSMPCDSPEQIKQLFGEWVTAETFEYAPEIEAAIEVFQSHASQQCASLREQIEELKKEVERLKIDIKRAEEYKPEIEEQAKTERVMVIAAELETEYQQQIEDLQKTVSRYRNQEVTISNQQKQIEELKKKVKKLTHQRDESFHKGYNEGTAAFQSDNDRLREALKECHYVFVSLSGEAPARISKIIQEALQSNT
jgi:chromosome segregation ATPase